MFMSDSDLMRVAPSIFAQEPWERMSSRYRFVPTIGVVEKLRDEGFFPVMASQGKTRIPGKREFTRHMIRFRQEPNRKAIVGEEIPEVVLLNSHDGTSAYNLMAGVFRFICSNGMVVPAGTVGSIKVRHSGADTLPREVIDASYKIIADTPKVFKGIEMLKKAIVNPRQQLAFATAALPLRESTLDIEPRQLLVSRRPEDGPTSNGDRSVWNTFNVVQENLVRGGIRGRTTLGRHRRTNAISNPGQDVKLNRALWTLAEELKKAVA
jgi:hypothetical protein